MQKTWLITLCALFGLAMTTPNYNNPSAADGDWMIYNNCYNPPSGYLKSPIFLKNSACISYESFNLTMDDDTAGSPFDDAASMRQAWGTPKRVYTGGKLVINGQEFTSADYHVRTKSEHILFSTGAQSDAEIQVFFERTIGNTIQTIGLAFLIKQIPEDSSAPQYTSSPYAQLMSSITAENWQLNFQELADRITNHASYKLELNMFSYPGTLTYLRCDPITWLVFGQELYATKDVLDIIRAHTATVNFPASTDAGDYNARPYTGIGGGSGEQAVAKLCYFSANFSATLKVFSGVLLMIAFFIFNL